MNAAGEIVLRASAYVEALSLIEFVRDAAGGVALRAVSAPALAPELSDEAVLYFRARARCARLRRQARFSRASYSVYPVASTPH
jgi:hypothetical protein